MYLQLIFGLAVLLAVSHAAPPNPGSFANRVTCGSTGRTCIQQEATCTNGACVCKEIHEEAKGDFRCYQDKSMVCELKSDPSLRTFNGEVENFPFPCRYMVTHVRTDLKNKFGDLIGTCESKVFGFNGKADGKYIVLGFDVQIKIMYTNPAKSVISTFRHSATAINNANSVTKFGKSGIWDESYTEVDDVTYTDNPLGVKVLFTYDNTNNRFIYRAEGCGLEVIHTPYDLAMKLNQKQVPGLSVEISKNNEPTYFSNDKVMCLVPRARGGALYEDIQVGFLSYERSLVLRAFKAGITQNVHGGGDAQCTSIGNRLKTCNLHKQKLAMMKCDWILNNIHFVKCYDKSVPGQKLLTLFNSCVTSWCSNSLCTEAIQLINTAGCGTLPSVPQLRQFMRGAACPGGSSEI